MFAVEGEAPELKWETMAHRQQARCAWRGRGGGGQFAVRRKGGGRSRFKTWLKEVSHVYMIVCNDIEGKSMDVVGFWIHNERMNLSHRN